MHIDHRQLQNLAAAVDEPNHGADTSRRGLLAKAAVAAPVVALGAALGPLTGLLSTAAAADELSDFDLVAFAQTIELSTVAVYEAAAAATSLTGDQADVVKSFGGHHSEHATLFETILNDAKSTPPGVSNAALDKVYGPRVAGATTGPAVLTVLLDLENALAATYLHLLGLLQNTAAAATMASILAVDAQHATVLATALGQDVAERTPETQTDDGQLDPATFPVPAAEAADSGTADTTPASS